MIIRPKWYDYFMLPYLWVRIMLLERTNNYLWESRRRLQMELELAGVKKELEWCRKKLTGAEK